MRYIAARRRRRTIATAATATTRTPPTIANKCQSDPLAVGPANSVAAPQTPSVATLRAKPFRTMLFMLSPSSILSLRLRSSKTHRSIPIAVQAKGHRFEQYADRVMSVRDCLKAFQHASVRPKRGTSSRVSPPLGRRTFSFAPIAPIKEIFVVCSTGNE